MLVPVNWRMEGINKLLIALANAWPRPFSRLEALTSAGPEGCRRIRTAHITGSSRPFELSQRLSYPDIARAACAAGMFVCQTQAERLSLAVERPSRAESGCSCIRLPQNDLHFYTAAPFGVTSLSMLGLLGLT